MAIPTSATSVALIDRLYNSGSGIVLHPETELKVVSMTTDQYLSKYANRLELDTTKLWTSAVGPTVAASYCPLEAVVDGTTQYADMYVNGGTATQTELPGSTGYGTLVVPVSTVFAIRPVGTATNNGVPTELAAAVALAGKENVLVGGSCVVLSRDAANTTINVDATTTIRAAATAADTKVPTEKAVRTALIALDTTASSYADNAEGRANTFTTNKDIAVSSWVINNYAVKPPAGDSYILSSFVDGNFVKKTDSATVNSSGIVKLHAEVTGQTDYPYLVPTEAAIKDYVDNHGGNGKPVSSATNGAIYVSALTASYTVSAQVKAPIHIPTTGQSAGFICVQSATDDRLGVVSAPLSSGLIISNGGLILASATSNTIGGVQIPDNRGLTIGTSGSLTLSKAPVTPTFGSASNYVSASAYGGVVVMMGNLGSTAGNWTDLEQDAPVVPNVSAMKQYTSANFIGSQYVIDNFVSKTDSATTTSMGVVSISPHAGLVVNGGSLGLDSAHINAFHTYFERNLDDQRAVIVTENWTVVDSSGELVYYRPNIQSTTVSWGNIQTRYATVTHSADIEVSGGAAKVSGYYGWSSGTVSMFTMGATPAVNDPVFSAYTGASSGTVIGHVLTAPAGGSMTVARWGVSLSATSSAETTTKKSFPIAEINVDSTGNVTIYQLQKGPIISGSSAIAPSGGAVVSAGEGIIVSSDTPLTSYTVQVDWMAPLKMENDGEGGQAITLNYSTDHFTNSNGVLTLNAATTSKRGGVIVGDGLSVDGTGKISVTGGTGGGGYDGPFKATDTTGNAVHINSGYVVTKYLTHKINAQNVTAAANNFICLKGSVDTVGELIAYITGTTYNVTATGTATGAGTRTGGYQGRTNGITQWGTNIWTKDTIPVNNTIAYSDAACTQAWGTITSYNYLVNITQVASDENLVPQIVVNVNGGTHTFAYANDLVITGTTSTDQYMEWSDDATPTPTVVYTDYDVRGAIVGTTVYSDYPAPDVGPTTVYGTVTAVSETAVAKSAGTGVYKVDTTNIEPNAEAAASTILNLYSTTTGGPLNRQYWGNSALPTGGRWMRIRTKFVGGYYVDTDTDDEGCIPIAAVGANREIEQQQYGNIQLQNSNVDTVCQFAIRERAAYDADGSKHTYTVDNVECMRLELASYRGFLAFGGVMECAGMLYGLQVQPDMFMGIRDGRGVWLNRYAVTYPEVTMTERNGAGTPITTGKTKDALYVPTGSNEDIWINFKYNTEGRTGWIIEVNTSCNENGDDGAKWYSVQLALTGKEGVKQLHEGPIDIRGRWS